MLDDVGAFAGAVSDEEAWALLEVFGEAGLVDDGGGGFGQLAGEIPGRAGDDGSRAGDDGGFKDGGVDFHAAGVDHRDDEAGIPDQVGDDSAVVGDDGAVVGDDGVGTVVIAGLTGNLKRLSHKRVKSAHCDERLACPEAKALGCRDTYTKTCVRSWSHADAHGVAICKCESTLLKHLLDEDCCK